MCRLPGSRSESHIAILTISISLPWAAYREIATRFALPTRSSSMACAGSALRESIRSTRWERFRRPTSSSSRRCRPTSGIPDKELTGRCTGVMLRLLTYPVEPAVPRRPATRRVKPSTRPVDPFSRLRQAITPTDDKAQGRPLSQTDVCETYARELCAEPRVIDYRRRPE